MGAHHVLSHGAVIARAAMPSAERECLRRLAAFQLILGAIVCGVAYFPTSIGDALKPVLGGAVLAVGACGLMVWGPLWRRNDSKRALAMLMKAGAAELAGAAQLAEADLRAGASMLNADWLAVFIRDRAVRGAWGDLHVLQRGTYKAARVPQDAASSDAALGFVVPPGVHLPAAFRVKALMGQAGELGRVAMGSLDEGLSGNAPGDSLLALLTAWWSMRLDNRQLAADAESRLLDIVESLITSVEAKDFYTSGHSKRVCRYSERIAQELEIGGKELEEIAIGAALHDVGKLGIPERVLGKPAKLDEEEWKLMQSHPKVGAHIIDSFNQSPVVLHMIFHHHEHWNGKGYPAGLAGEAIPFAARIVGVADALDAMTSARSYQRNRTVADALEELRRSAGRQFDPRIVDAVCRIPLDELEAIAPGLPAAAPVPAPVAAPALVPMPALVPIAVAVPA